MRVVYLGTPQFSADILTALIQDITIEVVGVICRQDERLGRKKVLTSPPTKIIALQHSIPVFQPEKLRDEEFLQQVRSLAPDVAVIVAYGRILPMALLNTIPRGFINLHPSLLPKYRGPSPMQAAIAAGDSTTGVTIMKIDEGMDTGPILSQQEITIDNRETTLSLTQKVVKIGAPQLITALKGFMDGSIIPSPQPSEHASLCTLLTREHGEIDWSQTAHEIDCKVRAFTPWPGTWTTWSIRNKNETVKILETFPSENFEGISPKHRHPFFMSEKLYVMAADSPLQILRLQLPGGKPMSGAEFARGYLQTS